MGRLSADFSAAFSRDLKKKAKRRNWDLSELQKLIDLVLENTPESIEILKRRHNMHRLSGNWAGRNECHAANSGDWLVIWSSNGKVAFFERTGSHDELFRQRSFMFGYINVGNCFAFPRSKRRGAEAPLTVVDGY